MPLREEYRQAGIWLFRRRSYLPVLMIAIVVLGTGYFEFPGESEHLDDLWEIVCLLIACSGIGIRVFTIGHTPQGTSGTNTHGQVADLLNTTGMYSLVRHPLYLGNFIMWLGIFSVSALAYVTIRRLKKKTRLLDVKGR